MNINDSFPSRYLASQELPANDLILTIRNFAIESVGQDDDMQDKPIVYFEETQKGLLLNKTNATTISHLYGSETDGWIGKQIALFATEVDFRGKQVLAIRVRLKAPSNSGVTRKSTPARTDSPENGPQWSEPNQEYLALVATILQIPVDVAETTWKPIAARLKTKADVKKITSITHPEAQALAIGPLQELVSMLVDDDPFA